MEERLPGHRLPPQTQFAAMRAEAIRPAFPLSLQRRANRRVKRGFFGWTREFHVMRAAEFFGKKIDFEFERQILAVPAVSTQHLLVVGSFLVPVGEKRG